MKADIPVGLPTKEEAIEWYNSQEMRGSKTDYHSRIQTGLDRIHPGPGKRVLDLGCGTGINTLYLARQGCKVTAVDFADKVIEYAEKESKNRNITYICEDVLEFKGDGMYDLITLIDLIHIVEPGKLHELAMTVAKHSHDRTLVYLTAPISYYLAFETEREHDIQESQIPLATIIALFDRAGFVPMGVDTFGTVAPVEHWEIIFITKAHLNHVWQEIYNKAPASPDGGVPKGEQEGE